MEFSVKVKNRELEQEKASCLVVGVFETGILSSEAKQLDELSGGYLSSLVNGNQNAGEKKGELEGKVGQTLLLHRVPNSPAERILLVGCGKETELDGRQYKKIVKQTFQSLKDTGATDVIFFLTGLCVKDRDVYWKLRQAVQNVQDACYAFEQLKTKNKTSKSSLNHFIFNVLTEAEFACGKCAVEHGLAIAQGIKAAKDLANMPPNLCNALYLFTKAKQLADGQKRLSVQAIDEKEMQDLGMHAYLAVSQGSKNEALMSILEYKGSADPDSRPIVLVGKGLTFDSGGISIKPAAAMDEMKYDMCGAAAVYGVMCVVAQLNLPLNIIGVLAGCENMPDGGAIRPGDVLTTLSGQTVEVLNTDAEGRLVLCDALSYVERFNPDTVIDIATLTGACVVALGHHFSGLMSNHDPLAEALLKAAKTADDDAWRLPMSEDYQEQLDSNFADMANIGDRFGGAITAACYLSRFTKDYHWAHLDIAGTAWQSGKNKGATGRPVALLTQYLLDRLEVGK